MPVYFTSRKDFDKVKGLIPEEIYLPLNGGRYIKPQNLSDKPGTDAPPSNSVALSEWLKYKVDKGFFEFAFGYAQNGLTINSPFVELGGSVVKPTTISTIGATNVLTISNDTGASFVTRSTDYNNLEPFFGFKYLEGTMNGESGFVNPSSGEAFWVTSFWDPGSSDDSGIFQLSNSQAFIGITQLSGTPSTAALSLTPNTLNIGAGNSGSLWKFEITSDGIKPTLNGTGYNSKTVKTNSTGNLVFVDQIFMLTAGTEQSTDFTAVSDLEYPCNSTSAVITVTPPATPVADTRFAVFDSRSTASTNNIKVDFSTQKLNGLSQFYDLVDNGDYAEFRYYNSTIGWRVRD